MLTINRTEILCAIEFIVTATVVAVAVTVIVVLTIAVVLTVSVTVSVAVPVCVVVTVAVIVAVAVAVAIDRNWKILIMITLEVNDTGDINMKINSDEDEKKLLRKTMIIKV